MERPLSTTNDVADLKRFTLVRLLELINQWGWPGRPDVCVPHTLFKMGCKEVHAKRAPALFSRLKLVTGRTKILHGLLLTRDELSESYYMIKFPNTALGSTECTQMCMLFQYLCFLLSCEVLARCIFFHEQKEHLCRYVR